VSKSPKNRHGGAGRDQGRKHLVDQATRLAIGRVYEDLVAEQKGRRPYPKSEEFLPLVDYLPCERHEATPAQIKKAIELRWKDIRSISRVPKQKGIGVLRPSGPWRPTVLAIIRDHFEDELGLKLSDRTIARYHSEFKRLSNSKPQNARS
jgi:hypothetical protein